MQKPLSLIPFTKNAALQKNKRDCVTVTFVVLKTVTSVWACAYAKISIKKTNPTLSLVLALASSPRVHDTAASLWTMASGSSSRQCVYVCVCV